MKIRRGLFKGATVVLLFALAACGGGDGGATSGATGGSPTQTITGLVQAPQGDTTFARNETGWRPLRLLAAWAGRIVSPVRAAVSGLVPVAGATVELVRLDPSTGAVVSTLATTPSGADGSYAFTNAPVPADATLAVRVAGQAPAQMRAIVTGSQVDVTPVSETVTQAVVAAGSLTNFAPSEVAALDALLIGMAVDVAGQTFDQAVTTLTQASTPILPDMAQGMGGTQGMASILANKGYGLTGVSLTLSGSAAPTGGGVVAGRERGNFFLDQLGIISNLFSSGSLFDRTVRHDLSRVDVASSRQASLGGVQHVPTPLNQLVVDLSPTLAVGGLVAAAGELIAYPVDDGAGPLSIRRGLRIALSNGTGNIGGGGAGFTALDRTALDDPLVAGPTRYRLVEFVTELDGPVPSPPGARIAFSVRHGELAFDAGSQVFLPGSTTQAFSPFTLASALEESRVDIDLASQTITPTPFAPPSAGDAGWFTVFRDGTLQIRATDAALVGQGNISQDGRLASYYVTGDFFAEHRLDVLANDDAVAGRPLTITAVATSTAPTQGAVRIAPDSKALIYTANGTGLAPDSFDYTVSDGVDPPLTATVTITPVAVDAPPVANDDSLVVPAATNSYRLDVLANDSDAVDDTICIARIVIPPAAGASATITATADAILYSNPALAGQDTLSYEIANPVISQTTGQSVCPATGSAQATVTLTPGTPPLITAPFAHADSLSINIDDRARRGIAIAVKEPGAGVSLDATRLTGRYTIVSFEGEALPSTANPTKAVLSTAYRYGTLDLDGAGGVTAAALFGKRAELELATLVVGQPATPSSPDGIDTLATNTYTVGASGQVTLQLTLASGEAITGKGVVSDDGGLLALAVETATTATGRLGRGIWLLSRQ